MTTQAALAAPSDTSTSASTSPTIAQNWLDLDAERGLSTFDQRNLLTATIHSGELQRIESPLFRGLREATQDLVSSARQFPRAQWENRTLASLPKAGLSLAKTRS